MNTITAIIIATVLGFAITAVSGFYIIPKLKKLKMGQTILDIGPTWHKSKEGTPTMGGIMFIIGTVIAFIVTVLIDKAMGGNIVAGNAIYPDAVKAKIYGSLLMALAFGIIGFLDDYIKVKKHRNEGLTVKQKTLAEILVIGAYTATLVLSGNRYLYIPFVGYWDYGSTVFFCIFTFIVIYATVNAVNFTDGIDGLCASVTTTVAISFAVMTFIRSYTGATLLASALAGACAGFLVWNWHPAKCFMGDTGSMFLGGMVVAFAYIISSPLILLVAGIVYVIEGLSDVIQILYFKITRRKARKTDPQATGKRLLKMAPLHHHFEKSGWSEEKIVYVFSLVSVIGGVIACIMVYNDTRLI